MDEQTQLDERPSQAVVEAEVEAIVEAAEAESIELGPSGLSQSAQESRVAVDPAVAALVDEIIPPLPTIYDRIRQLRADRAAIDREISRLSGRYRATVEMKREMGERPSWGPCTRCGHEWLGDWRPLPPVCCPQCHSPRWAIPPRNKNARRPTDAPNPKWKKNQKVGKGKRNQWTSADAASSTPDYRPIDGAMPPPPPGYSAAPPLPSPRPLADHLKELRDRGRDV